MKLFSASSTYPEIANILDTMNELAMNFGFVSGILTSTRVRKKALAKIAGFSAVL